MSVLRNAPYAGGYTTRRYGRPRRGVHVLQIELNRALYMNELDVLKSNLFGPLQDRLQRLITEILDLALAENS
jgi:N-formylglutamate amidohydrolase